MINTGPQIVDNELNSPLLKVFSGDYGDFRRYLENKNITKLNLSKKQLSPLGISHILLALKGTRISELDISNNHIGSGGIPVILKALQTTSLTFINFSYTGLDDKAAQIIVNALPATTVKIDFSGNLIKSSAAERIAKLIQTRFFALTALNLGENNIQDKGAIALSKVLYGRENKIDFIHLNRNNIKANGIKAIFSALTDEVNTLDLSRNPIGDDAKVFEKLIVKVENFNLSKTDIAENVANVIARKCVGKSKTLNLSNNKIKDKGAKAIINGLLTQTSQTTQTLDLRGNKIKEPGIRYIEPLILNTGLVNFLIEDNLASDKVRQDNINTLSGKEQSKMQREQKTLANFNESVIIPRRPMSTKKNLLGKITNDKINPHEDLNNFNSRTVFDKFDPFDYRTFIVGPLAPAPLNSPVNVATQNNVEDTLQNRNNLSLEEDQKAIEEIVTKFKNMNRK